jgi:hypothetical protein
VRGRDRRPQFLGLEFNSFIKVEGMNTRYDVYRSLPNDRLVWIKRVNALDEARQVVAAALQSASLANYLVYDYRARSVVEVLGPEFTAISALAA